VKKTGNLSCEKDEPLSADANKKAGYPPKCNTGYEVSDDGKKCVPTSKEEKKPESTTEALESPDSEELPSEPDHQAMEDDLISSSVKIVEGLKSKVKKFNKANRTRVTYPQLEKVFLSGANNRIRNGKTLCQSALARVNMYLSMKSGDPEYKLDKEKTTVVNFLDVTAHWIPDTECFEKADEDIKNFGLECNFASVDDLYLSEHKKPIWIINH
jgi:hypothetical protein